MINARIAKWIFLFLVILLTGCASSELKLELSIYKDDPLYKNVLTQDDIKPVKAYLKHIQEELDPVIAKKIQLSQLSFTLFKDYWDAQGEVYSKKKGKKYDTLEQQEHISVLKPLNYQLIDYKKNLLQSKQKVLDRLKQANEVYDELYRILPADLNGVDFSDSTYIGLVQRYKRLQQALSIEISTVFHLLTVLLNDNDHEFYQSTRGQWNLIIDLVESGDYQKYLSKNKLHNLKNSLKHVVKAYKNNDSNLITLQSDIKTSSSLVNGYKDVVLFVNSTMKNPVYSISAKGKGSMLRAIDLLISQIDRLQNAGSPIWRIVTDPKNSKKWNKKFSKTYYYAQGNSGVVVVRDTPIKYRVQEATNNPAALVQAQLQVSRAVADAAIQIAGATTGVPLVSVNQAGGKNSKSDNATYQQQTDTLVTRKAKIDAQKKIYIRSIDAIEGNIDSYIRQLKELNPKNGNINNDQAEINAISQRIIEFLKAQKKLVDPVKITQEGNQS